MGRVFFCGDVQGRFEYIIKHRPEAVVFLGDQQAKYPLEEELRDILDTTDIWRIHGNYVIPTATRTTTICLSPLWQTGTYMGGL